MRVDWKSAPDRARKVLRALRRDYPDAHIELEFADVLELVVATILSAQCTDKRVNALTKTLFRKYHTVEDYANADPRELEQDIMPAGFYRNKTKSIQACCRMLIERFGGQVPGKMEELIQLPGFGRKTANVILIGWFHQPGITVDTHVIRLSHRLGLARADDPVKIEFELDDLLPRTSWAFFSNALIWHGRRVCHARKPNCAECSMNGFCPSAVIEEKGPKGHKGRKRRVPDVA